MRPRFGTRPGRPSFPSLRIGIKLVYKRQNTDLSTSRSPQVIIEAKYAFRLLPRYHLDLECVTHIANGLILSILVFDLSNLSTITCARRQFERV